MAPPTPGSSEGSPGPIRKILGWIPWPLLLLVAGIGYTAAGEAEYRRQRDTMFSDVVRNQILAQRLRAVGAEVERAGRKLRFYPRSAEELNRVVQVSLPRSPWGGQLSRVLDADPHVIAAAERRGVDYKIIGNGLYDPDLATSRAYGAVLYRGDGRSFTLYGVGKIRDWAVVVATERGSMD